MQSLDNLLPSLGSGTTTATYNVDSCLAEVEDLLSYCNDILCTGTAARQGLHLTLLFHVHVMYGSMASLQGPSWLL